MSNSNLMDYNKMHEALRAELTQLSIERDQLEQQVQARSSRMMQVCAKLAEYEAQMPVLVMAADYVEELEARPIVEAEELFLWTWMTCEECGADTLHTDDYRNECSLCGKVKHPVK